MNSESRFRVITTLSLFAVAASAGIATLLRGFVPLAGRSRVALIPLLIAFAVVERFPMHLETERGVFTWTAYEIPLTLAIFYARPLDAFIACTIGTTLVRATRRLPLPKLAFNTATVAVHSLLALVAVHFGIDRVTDSETLHLVGTLVVLEVLGAANTEMVAFVIRFAGGTILRDARSFARSGSMVAVLSSSSLALVAVVVVPNHVPATAFLGVVSVVFYAGIRRFTAATQKILALRMLQDFAGRLSRTSLTEEPSVAILDHVRTVLRAERAEIVLMSDDSWTCRTDPTSTQTGPQSTPPKGPLFDRSHELSLQVVERREVIRMVRGLNESNDAILNDLGIKDVMIAPLIRGDEVFALLTVADRVNGTSTFSDADKSLFETMASHAMMTMENGHLVDRLRFEVASREHESLHDSLTGLANRTLYNRTTDSLLANVGPDAIVAVMLMDLNRFKEINDTLGHHIGDQTLQTIAERLRHSVPANAILARLGGDEFALTLPGLQSVDEAMETANRLLERAGVPLDIGGVHIANDLAIGVAISPLHGLDRATLLKRADAAMYRAKEERRSAAALFEREQETATERSFALVVDLRAALKAGELVVHYQPRVALPNGSLAGFEALVRWFHPVHGTVSPDEFVPLAERSGLIFELTELVLRQAVKDCAHWRACGIDAPVGVNLSARTSLDQNLAGLIASALGESGLPPSALTLEITEHELMNDAGALKTMLQGLRDTGITVAVDDFGTGHSSLAYLTSLPIDELKIDKGFVFAMANSATERAIVQAIVSLGISLGLHIVAEGVEDAHSVELLGDMGCHFAQGYHFARPMPANDIPAWLERHLQQPALVNR